MTTAGMGPSLWDRFEAEADHGSAVRRARQWLEDLPPGAGPNDLHQAMMGAASPTLSAVLRSAGLARWADIVASMACDDAPDGVLGKALLFRAAVQVVGSSERADFLDLASAALEPLLRSECGATVELAAWFASDPEAQVRLEAALLRLINEGKTDPSKVARHPRPRELEPVPPTTQNLWSSPYANALVRHDWAYEALRVDPAAYTRLLHALPVGLAHSTVMLSHDFALNELATLVGAAPSAFDIAGAPVASGALYAPLEQAHQTLAKLDQASLASSVVALLDAVLSRADAPWLGRAWGQRVLWEASHQNAARLQTWSSLLLNALTARLAPLADLESQSWIKAERLDLWRADRVLIEAAILLDHGRRAEVPDLLEWALAEGLVSATGRERAFIPDSFEANLLTHAFADKGLADWFERVWRTGYPGRERRRIGRYCKIDDTAQATLCWGLAALNRDDVRDTPEVWDVVFQALREIYLLDGEFNWIGEVGPSIFRFAAALCTAVVARGELAPDRLIAFLDLTIGPTVQFGGFIAMMVEQDEAVTLAAARASSPGRVQWALERGVLAVPLVKSRLTAEALALVKAFAAKLS